MRLRIVRHSGYPAPMQYRLRTLHILLAIGPPLLALAWWTAQWFWAYPIMPMILAYVALCVFGHVACYRELMRMICGPYLVLPSRRKKRRQVVRLRVERYAPSS
jgi:fatty acid desaturase